MAYQGVTGTRSPIPVVQVGDRVVRAPSFGLPLRPASAAQRQSTLPTTAGAALSLEKALRNRGISRSSRPRDLYWSYALLKQIMTPEVVRRALERECRIRDPALLDDYCRQIVPYGLPNSVERWRRTPDGRSFAPSQAKGYLAVLAMLVQEGKGHLIETFVKYGISDSALPLDLWDNDGEYYLLWGETGSQVVPDIESRDAEHLFSRQWPLIVPFFGRAARDTVPHYVLPDDAVLPWNENAAGTERSTGGFSTVIRVPLKSECHGFHEILESIKIGDQDQNFAIKTLHNSDAEKYKWEVDMLKRFSGKEHPHLVTLLATYTLGSKYHFVFPAASCNLLEFWQSNDDFETRTHRSLIRWISKQVTGLAEAMHAIHEPGNSAFLEAERKFGRHGDLKPENVLHFDSPEKDMKHGILVISDFGLAAIHREVSRSAVPNKNLPVTHTYRAPECDIEGGKITRGYDIWTMGCLLLEMVCWLLEGDAGRQNFISKRDKMYMTGTGGVETIFFDVRGRNGKYEFSVKESVLEHMEALHNHPRCTEYLHELLQLIHNDMILVDRHKRIRSGPLCAKLRGMSDAAVSDPNYIFRHFPAKKYKIERKVPVVADLIEEKRLWAEKQKANGTLSPWY